MAKLVIPLVLSLPTGFEAGFASKGVFHPAIVITDVTVKNHVIAKHTLIACPHLLS